MFHFAYSSDGRLLAESCDLEEIASAVSTPSYVYARSTIERHYKVIDEAFREVPHLVCYAAKANSNGAILRLLSGLGSGADIVSGGELRRALSAGIRPESIVFSGVGKTREEMRSALSAGILAFNVESEPELDVLEEVARELGRRAPLSLRVNPDVDARTHPYIATGLKHSKFGIPIAFAPRLAERIRGSPHLALVGVDCHIGSQITALAPFLEAIDALLALVDVLKGAGHEILHVDIGGGLGIPYAEGEVLLHPSEYGAKIVQRMKGRSERLILEPGRVIVGNAGILLTRVLYVKTTPSRTFVIVDAAMNDLLRPSLYQAVHEIWPAVQRTGAAAVLAPVDVVGPVCESSDSFAKDRLLPRVEAGDLLAIMGAGAYGFSMSSTYNSRPRAAEVLVSGDRFHVVRERETLDALVEGESVPSWL